MNETLKPIRTAGISDYTPTHQIIMTIENSDTYCFANKLGDYTEMPHFFLIEDNALAIIVGKGRPKVGFWRSLFEMNAKTPRTVLGRFKFDQIQGKTVPFYMSCHSVESQAKQMLEYIRSKCPDLQFVIRMNWPMSPNEEVYYSCE